MARHLDDIVNKMWHDRKHIAQVGADQYLQGDTYPANFIAGTPEGSWLRQMVNDAHHYPEMDAPPAKEIWRPDWTKASDIFEELGFVYSDRRPRPTQYHKAEGHITLSINHKYGLFVKEREQEQEWAQPWCDWVSVSAKPKAEFAEAFKEQTGYDIKDIYFEMGWEHPLYGQLLIAQNKNYIGSKWVTLIKEWDLKPVGRQEMRDPAKMGAQPIG